MHLTAFLYRTLPGRLLLKGLTARGLSRLVGAFLDTPASGFLIPPFVRANGIDLTEFETGEMVSFNDCFSRRIKKGLRRVDRKKNHLIAPCDGLLSVWPVRGDTVFSVKNCSYTLESLLKNKSLAGRFEDGLCLVFRLQVQDYHRYIYADSGRKGRNVFIPGVLHTVRPVALEKRPVFAENCREFCLIRTEAFGTLLQMEVGAMLVGKICNEERGEACVRRGEEKGCFAYGGSSIVLLLQKDRARLLEKFEGAIRDGAEIPVRLGEQIGSSIRGR